MLVSSIGSAQTFDFSCGPCTPTLSIAEGAVYDRPGFFNDEDTIEGIWIDHNNSRNINDGETYPNGSNLPTGEFNYAFYTLNSQNNPAYILLDTTTGHTPYDGSCELVINGDHNRVKIRETFVINVPESLDPWIQRITFQDIQNNSIKHTPDVGGNETNIYDDGDFIPEEATHYRIRIRRTLGTNNGSYETEQISVPNSGDLNVCLSVVDIQDGLRIVNPNSSDNINGIFIGADYYSNGAVIPPGPHTNVRVSGVFNGRSYPHIDHAFNIGEECGNIVITKDTYSTFECSITVDIEPGLSFRLSGNTFVIDGLILNNQRYYNGDIIPQSDSGRVFALFSDLPDVDGYVVDQQPFGIRVDSDHCGAIGVPEDFEGVFKLLIPTLEGGGDISGFTYDLAGKNLHYFR